MDSSMATTLNLIKQDLCITSDKRDKYLMSQINSVIGEMKAKGIRVDLEIITHQTYVVDFVSWKFNNRKATNPVMPEFIKEQLRNLKAQARVDKG